MDDFTISKFSLLLSLEMIVSKVDLSDSISASKNTENTLTHRVSSLKVIRGHLGSLTQNDLGLQRSISIN